MVGAFDQNKLPRLGKPRNQSFELDSRAELIPRSADEQLWLRALLQEIELVGSRLLRIGRHRSRRRADSDQRLHPLIGTGGPQSDGGPKRKSGKDDRKMELLFEPIERAANIFDFADASIMLAVAKSRATEVEPQHGKPKTVQRLHRVKHDLIVKRAAKQWMRMANHRRMRRILRAGIEQRLQFASRAFEEERLDG